MNRMVPLVARRSRSPFTATPFAASGAMPSMPSADIEQAAGWLADAKLFASGWVGGLIVFGTMIA